MKQLSPNPKTRFAITIGRLTTLCCVLVIGTVLFTGCKSNTSDVNGSLVGGQQQMITSTIYGRILDEGGNALAGVTVSAGTATAMTDQRGIYILRNASVPSDRAVIIAKKPGYFDAAKAEIPGSNGVTRIETSMMANTTTATISAVNGGTVTTPSGAQVTFQPGSFVDASGNAYSGSVMVAARFLDPKNVNYFDFFSGDNAAQTATGSNVGLITAGVIRVQLHSTSGQEVMLNPAKPATLVYPQPIDPKAPTTMPLWYFDQTIGKWKEDGSATLTAGKYVGTVTHFTDWNLDYYDTTGQFGAYGDVSLRIVCNGIPVDGVVITIVGDDAPGKYFVHPGGKTGADGRIHFIRFPANRPVQIDVRAARNGGTYYINTPVDVTITSGQKLDLGDISLDSPCPAAIKGSLTNCADTASEGLVIATVGTTMNYVYTKTGNFTFSVPSATPITIDAMNVNGDQAPSVSVPALAASELRDIGAINICGSGIPSYFDLPINKMNIGSMRLSPDGSKIAIFQGQSTSLNIYDTKTGAIVSTITTSASDYVSSMEFSVDNSKLMLSTSVSGRTDVYDISNASATLIVSIPKIGSPHLYDDGSKVIGTAAGAAPKSTVVNVYSTTDGSIISTLHPTFTMAPDSTAGIALLRDEDAFAYSDPGTTGTDFVWSVASDAQARTFAVSGNPYYFAASEDGATVAHTTDYLTYSCYDTKTGSKIGDINLTTNGRESGLTLTKNFAYTSDHGSSALIVRITNIASGASSLRLLSDSTGYVRSITASRDESTLAAASYTTLRIWKLK